MSNGLVVWCHCKHVRIPFFSSDTFFTVQLQIIRQGGESFRLDIFANLISI
jgi:hypothetical protein